MSTAHVLDTPNIAPNRHSHPTPAGRTVILASPDLALRHRLRDTLNDLRWQVSEATGGAEAFVHLDQRPHEAVILDHWLPDLEVSELATILAAQYPGLDILRLDGQPVHGGVRGPRRHELLHALRQATTPPDSPTDPPALPKVLPHAPSQAMSQNASHAMPLPAAPTPLQPAPVLVKPATPATHAG